jgi:thymidylate synthase ThyX
MKIETPHIEILDSKNHVMKDIEVAARNCYLSYDKVKEGSDVEIVHNLIKRGHNAMLEFGKNVIFTCKYYGFDPDIREFLFETRLHRFVNATYNEVDDRWIYSMNPRTALDIYQSNLPETEHEALKGFRFLIENVYSNLILKKDDGVRDPDWDIFQTVETDILNDKELFVHEQVTVKAVTNRTVLAQWTRHRIASFAVTSMRYINWTKNKFGSELTFIAPTWYANESDGKSLYWYRSCKRSEMEYFSAIESGMKPEEARCKVLPDVRTDIICKASLEEWSHIFKERCSKAADPEIRRIMIPLQDMFIKRYPGLFG